jgi:hypothetical protein
MMTKSEYTKKIKDLTSTMTEIQIGEMGGFISYDEYVKMTKEQKVNLAIASSRKSHTETIL